MSNRINMRTTALTAALSLVLAAPTLADNTDRSGKGMSQDSYRGTSQSMSQDSSQSRNIQAQADKFDKADANRDGKLSSSEYQALQRGLQSRTGTMASAGSAGLLNKSVKDIKGMDVVNQAGQKIGEVDELVLSRNDKTVHAVISVGGFLGMGDTEITMPLEQLTWHQDKLIAPTTTSKQQLKERQDYNKTAYMELEDDQNISQLSTKSGGKQMAQSFSELDTNQDGRIDRSEFSAFEVQSVSPSGSAIEPTRGVPSKSY